MNLAALAAKAVVLGFKLAEGILEQWVINYGPTTRAHNPATDTTAITWQHTNTLAALRYNADDKRAAPADDARTECRLAIKAALLTAPAALDETARATGPDGKTWEVTNIEPDPTTSLIILSLRL